MNCESCAEDLTAYIDGELSETKARDVRTHLDRCGACRDEHRSLELSARFVETHARELQMRPESWNLVRARIAALPAPAPGLFQWLTSNLWWSSAVTALATAALALGFWGYMHHIESQRDLTHYMSEYIQAREEQEQTHRITPLESDSSAADAGVLHPEYVNNPFVTVRSSADMNPFRSEEQ